MAGYNRVFIKKLSFIVLVFSFCCAPLAYAQTDAAQHESVLTTIKKRGVLRVAMHAKDHPPFFMVSKTGELIGIDIELANDIATQLNVKLDINRDATTFDGVVNRVAKGLSDIAISKLSLTLKRALIVRYTNPYTSLSKSILTNRIKLLQAGKHKSAKEIFSQKGAQIATLSGSSYEAFAKRIFPNASIYGSTDWSGDIIPKLMKGEFWGAFRDELEVRRAIFLFKDASLYLIAVNLKDEQDPMMMVVHKDAPFFQNWLNLYIEYAYKKEPIKDSIERFKEYVYKK